MASEKLQVVLELTAGQYKKEVKESADATGRLNDSLGKTGQMADKAGKKLAGVGKDLIKNVTLPLVAFGVASVKAASDLAESMNAINVVFKDAAGTVEAFGETAAESAGLSQRAFNEAVIPIGQLLNNFGLTADASADAVLSLTQRAADLGSVLNVDTAVALQKFQAGLAGEAEPLKAFGVDVSVAAIKAEALALGLIRSGGEMSKSARAQAALSIIMRETAFAAGDFSNTLATSLPNQLKELKANAEDVAAALGTAMLPAVLDVVKGIKLLVDRFTDLSESQQEFVVKAGLTVGALGPVLFVAGKLVPVIKNLRNAILGLNVVLGLGGISGGIGLLKFLGGAAATAATGLKGLAVGTLNAAAAAEVFDFAMGMGTEKTVEETAAIDALHAAHQKLADKKTEPFSPEMLHAQQWDAFTTATEEAAEALTEAEEASADAQTRALELRDANREAAKSFRDDLTVAIAGFVTFFEGAVDEIDTSLTQLETQFEERNTQNERFWNGLAVLAAAGLNDLVAELQAQGPAAAGVVEELVANMDRAFDWERRIEQQRQQAAAMGNALANGLNGVKDTVGATFNAFGISLADQLEAGFSTADLGNTLTQLMDAATPSGTTTPGQGDRYGGIQQFASGGVVQGPLGSEQLIRAHAGETILPTHKPWASGGFSIGGMSAPTYITEGATIVLQTPMQNFAQDLQLATILATVNTMVEVQ